MKVEYRFAIEVRFTHPDAFLPDVQVTQNIIAAALLNGLAAVGMDKLIEAELKPLRIHRKKETSE